MTSESAGDGSKDEAEVRARLTAMEVRRDELIRLCLALPGGIGDAVLRDQLEELEKQMVPLQEALAKSDPHRQPERGVMTSSYAPGRAGSQSSNGWARELAINLGFPAALGFNRLLQHWSVGATVVVR